MRCKLVLPFVLIACAPAQATSLSPAEKAALARGTSDSCLETQVKDPANKAMTVGQLQTYCDCYAKAFADTMSAEDLEKNKETLTPEARKNATDFSQQCAASTLKK